MLRVAPAAPRRCFDAKRQQSAARSSRFPILALLLLSKIQSFTGGARMRTSFRGILVLYIVLVLFGFYILYMFEPVSMHLLLSRLFGPLT
jgi:hypothetical protein